MSQRFITHGNLEAMTSIKELSNMIKKKKPTKTELLARLNQLATESKYDGEKAYGEAVDLLLVYIKDPEISEAFSNIKQW